MMAANYHVYVGAETGLLKGIDVTKSKWENLNEVGQVNRENEICAMCWENSDEASILFGTRAGTVKSYSTKDHLIQSILQVTDSKTQIIRGLYKLNSKYITCTNDGKLSIWDESDAGNEDTDATQVTLQCGDSVQVMKEDPVSSSLVGVGGKENDLKLYNLERTDAGAIFKAKNVRDDWLDLRAPVWVTDIGYIKRATSSLVLTCTAYHQVRLYDPSTSQRRPMIDMTWEEHPFTCLSVCNHNERQVMLGNSIGEQTLLDLRNKKCIGKYKGGAGSVRSLQCHPSMPLVVSCGLDRYVRVHDVNSRVLLNKFYMKSRLNKLLITTTNWAENTDLDEEKEIKQELEENEYENGTEQQEDDDELWESLEKVEETGDKQKILKQKKRSQIIEKVAGVSAKKKSKKQKG